jgi:hypothetical protein
VHSHMTESAMEISAEMRTAFRGALRRSSLMYPKSGDTRDVPFSIILIRYRKPLKEA